jgi:hypothetical protein
MNFLDAFGLNEFFKSIKGIFVKKENIKPYTNSYQIVDMGNYLSAVVDKDSHILCFIDSNGKVHHPIGTVTSGLSVEGDAAISGKALIGDSKLLEADEGGMVFTLIDPENRMLLWINTDGTVDFQGIPTDVKEEIEALKTRVKALEDAQ